MRHVIIFIALFLCTTFVLFLFLGFEKGQEWGYRKGVKEVLEAQSAADMDGLCRIIEDYKADGFPPTETE